MLIEVNYNYNNNVMLNCLISKNEVVFYLLFLKKKYFKIVNL